MSPWNVAATCRAKEERDRACRALLEEAERFERAFHEGWLRANEGLDRDRDRGEPPVPLKGFQYVARIARAGLENDTALAFLGPIRPAVVASLAALERFLWHDFLLEEYDVEPLQQRLRFFLGLLAEAAPPGDDDFPVETAGEIGPFELRSRLANAIEPELMEIFCDKIPVLREIRREAAQGGPTRLLFRQTGVRWVARLIHYLSPHTWGPFITLDLRETSYEATRRACELLEWLPSWSTVFLPATPTLFTLPRAPEEFPPEPRLESRGRIVVGTRHLGGKATEELRLGDWPVFPGRVPRHPVTRAMIRRIDFLRGEKTGAHETLPSLRPAHLYWLEHLGTEKLGFCRLALAEGERLVERCERESWRAPREMLEIVDDVRLTALDGDRARQLRAFALLQRAESRAIRRKFDAVEEDLPEVEWLCGETDAGSSALWRLEIEVGLLETRSLVDVLRRHGSHAPPEDVAKAAGKLRQALSEQRGSTPAENLWLGRLCEVLVVEGALALKRSHFDAAVAALREALGRLPETGHDELRYAALLRLGLSEFHRGSTEAAWACAEALPELEPRLPTWFLEAQRRWLVGSLHRRALENHAPGEAATKAESEEASEEIMRKHLEGAVELWELHGGRGGAAAALRTLETLAQFYRAQDRADEYLEMVHKTRKSRGRMGFAYYYGPFCRYEVI